MALKFVALQNALLKGSTSPENPAKAAEALASIESRLSTLTWIAGTNVALTVAVLFKLFR